MKNIIIKALQYAADNNIICNVRSTNKMFDTYHDANGQRQCKITYNGYGSLEQRKKQFPDCFTIIRHCTFENECDKNKDGAIIMDIFPSKIESADKCRIWNNGVEFGGFEFIFHENLQLD